LAETLQAGRRALIDSKGKKTSIGMDDKTQAEGAPTLWSQALGTGTASNAAKILGAQRDDGTGDPTRVEYGGHPGSSTGQ
jgi:hypothetical protein